jgi:hypothetical protein
MTRGSIPRRPLQAINHQHVGGRLRGFKLQSQLLLNRGEKIRRRIGIVGWRRTATAQALHHSRIRRELQHEIVLFGKPGLIHHRLIQNGALQEIREFVDGCVGDVQCHSRRAEKQSRIAVRIPLALTEFFRDPASAVSMARRASTPAVKAGDLNVMTGYGRITAERRLSAGRWCLPACYTRTSCAPPAGVSALTRQCPNERFNPTIASAPKRMASGRE